MELGDFAVLITALGVGAILRDLVNRLMDRRRGKLEQEQSAWEQRDQYARRARRLEEALHEHRTCWHRETGRRFEDMPAWPSRTRPDDQ